MAVLSDCYMGEGLEEYENDENDKECKRKKIESSVVRLGE